MERHLNQRFSCAIYALTEDPDYLVFDADLWEGRDIVGSDPSEYSAVALVELRPGSVELVLDHGDGAYRLATDTADTMPNRLSVGMRALWPGSQGCPTTRTAKMRTTTPKRKS